MPLHSDTQPEVFELRAGTTGLRTGIGRLLSNWPVKIVAALGASVALHLRGLAWADAFAVTLGIIGATLTLSWLYFWLYGRSTVTLTKDGLSVRRFGVRRFLARAEVGQIFEVEKDWGFGQHKTLLHYWFITDRAGNRFVAFPDALWPDQGMVQLARALRIEPRQVTSRLEEARISPWWMRHFWGTTLVVGLVLTIVGGALWWGVAAWQEARRASAERVAERDFAAYAESELSPLRYPHLQEDDNRMPPSPFIAVAHAADLNAVTLNVTINLGGSDTEMPTTEALGLVDRMCAYTPPTAKSFPAVKTVSVTYESNKAFGYDRVIEHECSTERGSLEQWTSWAERHPAEADLATIEAIQEEPYGDEPSRLEVVARVQTDTEADFRTTLNHLCAYPAHETLTMHIYTADTGSGTQSARYVDCQRTEAELSEWRDSKNR
ncbi:hypothetical protein GCM10027417_09540 [Glutamicibacter endophyticus]